MSGCVRTVFVHLGNRLSGCATAASCFNWGCAALASFATMFVWPAKCFLVCYRLQPGLLAEKGSRVMLRIASELLRCSFSANCVLHFQKSCPNMRMHMWKRGNFDVSVTCVLGRSLVGICVCTRKHCSSSTAGRALSIVSALPNSCAGRPCRTSLVSTVSRR